MNAEDALHSPWERLGSEPLGRRYGVRYINRGVAMATSHHMAQGGVLTAPQDHLLVAALTLTAVDPVSARETVEALRGIVQAELHGDLPDETPETPADAPPPETGELGFDDRYYRYGLTVTVGFGAGALEKLGITETNRPRDLEAIPWEQLEDTPPHISDNGDLVLQICSDSIYVNEHVLRRVEHELADQLKEVWCFMGHQRHTNRRRGVSRDDGRALIGFLDGTANLDPRHNPADRALVFVDPSAVSTYPQNPTGQEPTPYGGPEPPIFPDLRAVPSSEPDWTNGGTYMVVRVSSLDIPSWDGTTLRDQQLTVGRWKYSGNALDQQDTDAIAPEDPDFQADPTGSTTPLTAHIRKVNPRASAEDTNRRIFRRGYPLVVAEGAALSRGLVFICFGRTITTQFEFIERAWRNNDDFPQPGIGKDRFKKFETVLGGGYFFVPPLRNARQPWSWVIPPVD